MCTHPGIRGPLNELTDRILSMANSAAGKPDHMTGATQEALQCNCNPERRRDVSSLCLERRE